MKRPCSSIRKILKRRTDFCLLDLRAGRLRFEKLVETRFELKVDHFDRRMDGKLEVIVQLFSHEREGLRHRTQAVIGNDERLGRVDRETQRAPVVF